MRDISPDAAATALAEGGLAVLDVREDWEVALAPFPGALHVPLNEVPARLAGLDASAPWLVVCHHGVRSRMAGEYLERQGFAEVLNLAGGIDAWAREVDPGLATY